ncbi:MAG: queuosine salvage family protein [bacterium]
MDNKVLSSIEQVIETSKFVEINKDKIKEFGRSLDDCKTKFWLDQAPICLGNFNQKERLILSFLFSSVNFCYWGDPKWTIEYEGKFFDGAWGMLAAIKRAYENRMPILDTEYLARISEDDFRKILAGNTEIPLFKERLNIFREVGEVISKKYYGDFFNLIKESGFDALELLDIIVDNFSSFDDVVIYKGNKVFFLKRAQLAIFDIYQILLGNGFCELASIDKLTAFADYKLPQVLRKMKILSYAPELSYEVDNRIIIKAGSDKEIEIRANTIKAVEMIKEMAQLNNPQITSAYIDSYLWLLGQDKSPDDSPYHLTRTIFY